MSLDGFGTGVVDGGGTTVGAVVTGSLETTGTRGASARGGPVGIGRPPISGAMLRSDVSGPIPVGVAVAEEPPENDDLRVARGSRTLLPSVPFNFVDEAGLINASASDMTGAGEHDGQIPESGHG